MNYDVTSDPVRISGASPIKMKSRRTVKRIREHGETTPAPTAVDFFAGSGLVTEALKNYFNVIWANDICDKKRDVYTTNHVDEHFHLGPIQNEALVFPGYRRTREGRQVLELLMQ